MIKLQLRRTRWLALAASAIALAGMITSASTALAAAPRWRIESSTAPTNLARGSSGLIVVVATNIGDAEISASKHAVTLAETLPAGLTATAVTANVGGTVEMECELSGVRCSTTSAIAPYHRLEVLITVSVAADASESQPVETTVAGGEAIQCSEVAGGSGKFTDGACLQEGSGRFEKTSAGAMPEAKLPQTIALNPAETLFGVERFQIQAENEDGTPDTQAGSHPFQLTSTLNLNQAIESNGFELDPAAPGLMRNVQITLPPGLLGDPQAVAQCPDVDFAAIGPDNENACPPGSAIGAAVTRLAHVLGASPGRQTYTVPVFNLVPAPGEPARFGFEVAKVPVIFNTAVQSGGNYSVVVSINNASQAAQVLASQVTLWGEPGAQIHDPSRGWACLSHMPPGKPCEPPGENERPSTPFLTLPTSCAGALNSTLAGDSWSGEPLAGETSLPALEGCALLPFTPSISVAPTHGAQGEPGGGVPNTAASTPTGLKLELRVPQQATQEPKGLAEATVKDTTVTLPQGLQLNPSAANGLTACSEQQIGFTGEDPQTHTLQFTPTPADCPETSKLGTVRISTPDLAHQLQGAVYLAAQQANPFGSLIALYITAEDPISRVRVKLAGRVTINEENGQLSTTFANTPQVPFENLELELFGGPRASLATPAQCARYTTTTSVTAWSGAVREPSTMEPFDITSGPGGSPCPSGALPFAPAFTAGVSNLQAGAYTPFTLTITHPDGSQPLQGVTMHLPPGVAAMLSSVTPCQTPPAGQEWACGPESLIGHSTAWAGLGDEPVSLPGTVYLTTGYGGAPFGLLVVTPAVAGPFNLGNVDVRSKINVDPNTAAVTVTSDPFPTFVKGVPADIKQLNVSVDRPEFEFNPTSCDPTAITGTLTGVEGTSEAVSSPFQVSGCGSLPFAPKLTASVSGHASRLDGVAFAVKLESKGLGQANIRKVDLQLPLALPSRLTTLQKACLAATFNASPASCSPESVIGSATIHTPVLKSALSGPAYLVSHGGAEFPDVEFVLAGEGITLVLDGKTQIKNGITYSRFETAPDAPFTSFETTLPAGPHSALTAYTPKTPYDVCGTTLQIPTEVTSQVGTTIKTTTPITTTGCTGVLASKTKLTNSQLLAKALEACRSRYKHSRPKRAACEKQARRRYPVKKTEAKNTRAARRHR